LRVNRYFKQVPDFHRDDDGNVVFHSLRGPAKIAAREQFVREKMIAIEECRMVREAMEDCYRREGIDARTHCKPLVKAYSQLIESPYWGMLKVRHATACNNIGNALHGGLCNFILHHRPNTTPMSLHRHQANTDK
jgi:hypothetical protein